MLQYAQPRRLRVDAGADDLRGAPWGDLVEVAGLMGTYGRPEVVLDLRSFNTTEDYNHHDDILLPLHDSGVRLGEFVGCVGTGAGVAALSTVARDADLRIHLAAPLDLSAFECKYRNLWVYTRTFPPPLPAPPASPTWPLPSWPKPLLSVAGADEGSWGRWPTPSLPSPLLA
ncbi:uncharacterized protein LOC108678954 [Hyalella azteca]|uniref:Uncharacterized protein LOC108678954 n=1 Tax=Hyalella azteca TaxID=294128 RepID=A0A8B7PB46_HYAAZ|nr:uncharacterized protein LOC108678954 [Hyalella azteca]